MKKERLNKPNVVFVIIGVVIAVYCLSLIFALSWAFLTSFKSRGDYVSNPVGFPKSFLFENYLVGFENFYVDVGTGLAKSRVSLLQMIPNTLLYAIGCSFFLTATNCIVAYCCCKFSKFKITKVYVTLVYVEMALPIVGGQAAELQLIMRLGIYDTMFGMWIMKMYFAGVYFLVFLAMFSSIPKDFADAGYIDGASEFTVLFKLMLPMVSGTFGTVMLIYFISYWNDYQTPLLYMPSLPTLAYGLYRYSFSFRTQITSVPMKMVGCMILFLPIFVVFICFQKVLIGNITMGGLKE